jgi:hypothetical protein
MARTQWTLKKRAAFLASLREDGNARRACLVCGIGRSTAYQYRADDEEFRAEWDAAVEEGHANLREELEEEAAKRAVSGSDTLLMFLLKKHDPSYREKHDINTTGEVSIVVRYAND